MKRGFFAFYLLGYAVSQQPGDQDEAHLPMGISQCSRLGCKPEATNVVMDQNWRWLHNVGGYKNCLKKDGSGWDADICKSPAECSEKCAIEGVASKSYTEDYGVNLVKNGVKLDFPKGPRLYLMDTDTSYKYFNLKNAEFTFSVDLSSLPCGVNAAIYFIEMPKNGGKDGKLNNVGAKYGTGYCDAQCPHMRFIPGHGANQESWKKHRAKNPDGEWLHVGPDGPHGVCCAEMDILEANRHATAWTVHPCDVQQQKVCTGDQECGNMDKGIPGFCDKAGCGWNPYRLGNPKFFGAGAGFTVDTSRPFSVVTQFVTTDGTDTGDLAEVRQAYIQDNKVIQNPKADQRMDGAQTISDMSCDTQSVAYQLNKSEPVRNDFKKLGGLRSMGEAFDRGMVLALSIWDDDFGRMLWLDGEKTTVKDDESDPGVKRGPCPFNKGTDADLQAKAKTAPISVTFSNIKYGPLGTTSLFREVPKALPALTKPIQNTPNSDSTTARTPPLAGTKKDAAFQSGIVPSGAGPAAPTPARPAVPPGAQSIAPPSVVPPPTAPAAPPAPPITLSTAAPPAAPPAPPVAPPTVAPSVAPPPPAKPVVASWTKGCEWIPKDNCKDQNKVACDCRKMNPTGPCTQCPNSRPKWTKGCEWLTKDNCKEENEFACKCREMNPSGPCTACPNSRPRGATGFQAKFDNSLHGGVGLDNSSRWSHTAGIMMLMAVVALSAFMMLKRRRLSITHGIGASSGSSQMLPFTELLATDEETLVDPSCSRLYEPVEEHLKFCE